MTDLAHQHLLVVGATGGLGSAISRQLAGAGARLTLAGRDADRLAALASDLASAVVGTVKADLADPTTPARLAAVADREALDGLVLAAGVVAFGALTEIDDDDLDQLFLVNVLGPIRVIRALTPHLGRGATVVNLSAVVAESPTAGMAAYSATKAALTGFDRALALELRRAGVRVLDVRPPHTETGRSPARLRDCRRASEPTMWRGGSSRRSLMTRRTCPHRRSDHRRPPSSPTSRNTTHREWTDGSVTVQQSLIIRTNGAEGRDS
jgi:short-subunit dehydrogenase